MCVCTKSVVHPPLASVLYLYSILINTLNPFTSFYIWFKWHDAKNSCPIKGPLMIATSWSLDSMWSKIQLSLVVSPNLNTTKDYSCLLISLNVSSTLPYRGAISNCICVKLSFRSLFDWLLVWNSVIKYMWRHIVTNESGVHILIEL